jgi:hypothetical protein
VGIAAADDVNSTTSPLVKDIPMMTRRRLGRLGRMALRVAMDAGACADDHLVFASRYGDSQCHGALMRDLASQKGLSPTDFSMSVHNAYAGVLSILQQNTHSHTAISAGADSFCAGLLEAVMLLQQCPEREVLLVYYEEPLEPYLRSSETDGADLALALRMSTGLDAAGSGEVMQIGLTGDTDISKHESQQGWAPALSFIHYLAAPSTTSSPAWEWNGNRTKWRCQRAEVSV